MLFFITLGGAHAEVKEENVPPASLRNDEKAEFHQAKHEICQLEQGPLEVSF